MNIMFHTYNYLNLQTRVWIFSRIVGELHQRVTPGTILEYITAEREQKFRTEKKKLARIVNPFVE